MGNAARDSDMTGVDPSGLRVVREAAPRRSDTSVGLDELMDLGRTADRNAAIVALSLCHEWSSGRLSTLFGVSTRRIQQIVGDFKSEILQGRPAPWGRGRASRIG